METETLKTGPVHSSKDSRSMNASLHSFNLPHLIEKMKQDSTWEHEGLNAKILINKPHKQVVITALHKGTEINSFQSNDSVTIQVMEGRLIFRTRNESVILEKDQMLTLQENIEYSLTTKAETVLLLTIAKGALQPSEN